MKLVISWDARDCYWSVVDENVNNDPASSTTKLDIEVRPPAHDAAVLVLDIFLLIYFGFHPVAVRIIIRAAAVARVDD